MAADAQGKEQDESGQAQRARGGQSPADADLIGQPGAQQRRHEDRGEDGRLVKTEVARLVLWRARVGEDVKQEQGTACFLLNIPSPHDPTRNRIPRSPV